MDPEIIFNGHACLSFKTSTGKTITCDPWISEEPVYANTEYRMPQSNS